MSVLALFTGAALAACAAPVDRLVKDHSLQRVVVSGTEFDHVVIAPPNLRQRGRLHVYIDGDGTPWLLGRYPAVDPTPRNPLALKLMLQDTKDSVYVGRPCYHGLAESRGCHPGVWTFGRYSEAVVASTVAAIEKVSRPDAYSEIVIIGVSGGGVLARLSAADVKGTIAVITVTANLDIGAWTDARGFLPLTDSLNPSEAEPLPDDLPHIQVVGVQDEIVPLSVTHAYRESGQAVEVWMYDDFDHGCCWQEAWPDILARIDARLAERPSKRGSEFDD